MSFDTKTQAVQATAARAAIQGALTELEQAVAAGRGDTRPVIQDSLTETRQLISQAIQAFKAGDYGSSLVKARSASEIPQTLLCVIGFQTPS